MFDLRMMYVLGVVTCLPSLSPTVTTVWSQWVKEKANTCSICQFGWRQLMLSCQCWFYPILSYPILFHGRTRAAYLYRCVWSGITGR